MTYNVNASKKKEIIYNIYIGETQSSCKLSMTVRGRIAYKYTNEY